MRVGTGCGFGVHEAMDQIGAVAGSFMVTAVLATWGSYRTGFTILLIPAVLGLAVLLIGQRLDPNPREFESTTQDPNAQYVQALHELLCVTFLLKVRASAEYADVRLH